MDQVLGEDTSANVMLPIQRWTSTGRVLDASAAAISPRLMTSDAGRSAWSCCVHRSESDAKPPFQMRVAGPRSRPRAVLDIAVNSVHNFCEQTSQ